MKPIQIRIVLLVMLLGGAGILLAAAASVQPTLAQVPTVTSLLTSGTVTPLFIGRTPVITPMVKLPPKNPRPTQYTGSTITPSGLLVAVNVTNSTVDKNKLAAFYSALPQFVGSLQLVTYQQNLSNDFSFVLQDSKGAGYTVTVTFYASAQKAYITFARQTTAGGMNGGQSVAVGDEAFIAPKGAHFIAMMRYNNVLVRISSAAMSGSVEPAVPPTVQDLTGVLEAILKVLQQ